MNAEPLPGPIETSPHERCTDYVGKTQGKDGCWIGFVEVVFPDRIDMDAAAIAAGGSATVNVAS